MLSSQQRSLSDAHHLLKSQRLESMMALEIDDETFYQALNASNHLTESQHINTAKMSEDAKSDVIVRLMRLFNTKRDLAERTQIGLFLVRYMHRLNRTGWREIYGDKHQYLSIIELLINNRHEKIAALSHDDLDLVLKEGMRVGSDHAYVTYLRLTLLSTDQEGFEGQQREGRRAAARYTKTNKKDFLKKMKEVGLLKEIDQQKHKENITYLLQLSRLCKEDYFFSFKEPTPESTEVLAKILDKNLLSSEAVFEMAVDLDYGKIILMLGQYHAKKAWSASEEGDAQEAKKHVDKAEACFNYLRGLPMLVDKVNAMTKEKSYGQALDYIGSFSRTLDAGAGRQNQNMEDKPGLPYILLGANYGHEESVTALLSLINRNGSDEAFKAYLNKYMARLPVASVINILNELLKYKEGVLTDARRKIISDALETQEGERKSLETLPSKLQYQEVIKGSIDVKLEHEDDVLHVHSGGSSVYMVVTKVDEVLEAQDDNKPKNDEYKLYVAFDPYATDNYAKCWSVLLKDILGKDNVYGVKMMNPQDAEADYDFLTREQRVLKENAQPGKMAVIYFKKYETLKQTRGAGYTEEMFYLENLALIEKFERALKLAGVTNDDPSVEPDHSLPARIKREGQSLVFISGRETDANGAYVRSKDRIPNTPESNPYTNKAILFKYYGADAELIIAALNCKPAPESEESAESSPPLSGSNSSDNNVVSAEEPPSEMNLDEVLSADPTGAALDAALVPNAADSAVSTASTEENEAIAAKSNESSLVSAGSTESNESPSASFIAKPKPSLLSRVFSYYKTNPWKAGLLTAGVVLSIGLTIGLSIATVGAFPLVAGGIAVVATALHITTLGASIGGFVLAGLSTLGFGSTLGAMLFRTGRTQKPQAQPRIDEPKPASHSTFARVIHRLCGSHKKGLLVDYSHEDGAPQPKPVKEKPTRKQRKGVVPSEPSASASPAPGMRV